MKNKRPIFLAGFRRGGTNLVMNLLLSHPEVCLPRGETHEVFRGKKSKETRRNYRFKRMRYRPMKLVEGDILHTSHYDHRRPMSAFSRYWFDSVLYKEKLRARSDSQNRWKAPGVEYTDDEVASSRLLAKNVDGLILFSRALAQAYPDATFIGLVRNGYAVCEGQSHRGVDINNAAKRYDIACRALVEDSERLPRFLVIRFEDLTASPVETLKKLYEHCDLDIDEVEKLRLELKPVMDPDGVRRGPAEKKLRWIEIDDLPNHVRKDVNANQIKHLPPDHRDIITKHSRWSLEHFGYDVLE